MDAKWEDDLAPEMGGRRGTVVEERGVRVKKEVKVGIAAVLEGDLGGGRK